MISRISLVDSIFAEWLWWTASKRQRWADDYRREANMTLEERNAHPFCRNRPIGPADHFELCRSFSWEAEMLADPALLDRVISLLTPEQRAEGARIYELSRSPHPLRVDICGTAWMEEWHCDACGTAYPREVEAIIVGDRPGWSALEYPITYCRECIAAALAAYDAGHVK